MSMTDPIADLFTRIRNALLVKHDRLDVPLSKQKLEVCRSLQAEGYISSVQLAEGTPPKNSIRVVLRYTDDGTPAIRNLQRVSRPGRRIHRTAKEIRPVLNGLGVGIISTSQGLMTDTQARERNVGGEVVGEVW